jgi:hypothetical protein
MSIIGLDPSIRNTGWGYLKKGEPTLWGTECSTYDDRFEACQQIAMGLEKKFLEIGIIGERATEPAHIFMEVPDPWLKKAQVADCQDVPCSLDQMVPVFKPHIGSDMSVARYGELWVSIGVIAGHLGRRYIDNVNIRFVSVNTWKGYETKEETRTRLQKDFGVRTGTSHEADAIMIALWGYHNYRDLE